MGQEPVDVVPVGDDADRGPGFADLPEAVRQRLVGWVAGALPEIAVLPPPLRRIRDFTPTRRARVGAAAIAEALDDPDLRRRAALVVPRDVGADGTADPVADAASAWLHRDEGWEVTLSESVATLARPAADDGRTAARVDALTRRLEAAEQLLRETRTRHRAELEELRADNARLRRVLGEERRTARQARVDQEGALARADGDRSAAEAALAAADRELRQLRTRVARADAETTAERHAERRAERAEREETTLRARMLLETVVDAAAGLRRELALPTATATPGERAEAALATAPEDTPGGAGLGPDRPALLDQLLAMPRARLVVDGYNVTKSVWATLPLETQRTRLARALAPLVARTAAETTVVFDAYQVVSRPVVAAPRGVRVVFSPEGVIADDVIRDLVAAEPTGRVVVVVTGDGDLARDVRRDGARVCAPGSLLGLLGP